MSKEKPNNVLEFREKVSRDNFRLWAHILFMDMVAKALLSESSKIVEALDGGDYETAINECEKIIGSIEMWMVPVRNKVQEMRNERYRRKKSKVVSIRRKGGY